MTKTNGLFRFQTIPSFLIQSDTIDFLSPALLSAGRGHWWSMTFSFFELSRWNGNHNTWLTLTLEVSRRGWGSTTDPSCPSVTVIIKLIILAAQRHRNSATNAVPLFQCCNTGNFCVEPYIWGQERSNTYVTGYLCCLWWWNAEVHIELLHFKIIFKNLLSQV